MSSTGVGAASIFATPKPANAFAPKTPPKPTCASYKDAFDRVTSKRCRNVFLTHLVLSFIATIVFQFSLASPRHSFGWRTITHTVLLFVFSSPLYLIRITMTKLWQPIPPSESAELLAKATLRDHWYMVVAYGLSGLLIIQVYFYHLMEGTYTYKLFVSPHGDRFGMRQLNQDYLFICVYGLMLGAGFAVRLILKDQWTLKITPVQQCKFMTIKQSLGTVMYDAGRWSIYVFGPTYVGFLFVSGFVYQLGILLVGVFCTMLDTPVVGFTWYDLYLFVRMLLGGFLAVLCWEMIDRIYNVFFAVTEAITLPFENAHSCLLTGLRDDAEPLLKGTAYAELAYLATKSPSQRIALFRNMGTDLNNTAWIEVSRECMKVLSTMRTAIEKEYDDGKKPAAPAPPAPKATAEPVPTNRIKLVDGDVFAAPKTNTVLLDDRTANLFSHASLVSGPAVSSKTTTSTNGVIINAPKERVFKLLTLVQTRVKQLRWVQNMCAITAERKTRRVFNNYPLLLSAIQALGSLTAASIKEDPYGLVQRDLGLVVDNLLASVIEVERLVRSPPAQYKNLPPGYSGDVLLMEPSFVLMALREAIYQIVTAFDGYLDQIKVDRKYVSKWQRFVEFRE